MSWCIETFRTLQSRRHEERYRYQEEIAGVRLQIAQKWQIWHSDNSYDFLRNVASANPNTLAVHTVKSLFGIDEEQMNRHKLTLQFAIFAGARERNRITFAFVHSAVL